MNRLVMAVCVWVVIVGGLAAYTQLRDRFRRPPVAAIQAVAAPGRFEVEITPTFDVAGGVDPFALETTHQPALVLSLNGREILRQEQPLAAGRPFRAPITRGQNGLRVGANEFYVQFKTPTDHGERAHGARLRLLRDGTAVADETVWASPGATLTAAVPLTVSAVQAATAETAEDR